MDPDEQHPDFSYEGEDGWHWMQCVRGHEWRVQEVNRELERFGLTPCDCPRCGEEGVLLES